MLDSNKRGGGECRGGALKGKLEKYQADKYLGAFVHPHLT